MLCGISLELIHLANLTLYTPLHSPPFYCLPLSHWLFQMPHIRGIMQAPSFSDWCISLSIMSSRSLRVVANGKVSFFLKAGSCSIVCVDCIVSIPSSVGGHGLFPSQLSEPGFAQWSGWVPSAAASMQVVFSALFLALFSMCFCPSRWTGLTGSLFRSFSWTFKPHLSLPCALLRERWSLCGLVHPLVLTLHRVHHGSSMLRKPVIAV